PLQHANKRQPSEKPDLVGIGVRAVGGESVGNEVFHQECADGNDPAQRMQSAPEERRTLARPNRRHPARDWRCDRDHPFNPCSESQSQANLSLWNPVWLPSNAKSKRGATRWCGMSVRPSDRSEDRWGCAERAAHRALRQALFVTATGRSLISSS